MDSNTDQAIAFREGADKYKYMSGKRNPQGLRPEHYPEGDLKRLEDQIYGEPSVEQKCTEISLGFLCGEYFHSTLAEIRQLLRCYTLANLVFLVITLYL